VPPNRLTTCRRPILTGTNPPLPIPSSTPNASAGFPTQPAASSTLLWTEGTPSGCPFCQINASPGGAPEVDKKPNFIEFYKISRSLHYGECAPNTIARYGDLQNMAKLLIIVRYSAWSRSERRTGCTSSRSPAKRMRGGGRHSQQLHPERPAGLHRRR
jgi:hypothetical protein